MNFLAHALLSGDDEGLLLGNFIADFVKGRQALMAYEGRVREGILLHRAIDAFTDTHPVVSLSKQRLRGKYRHYSGVIVDVFYDHFLAASWESYHHTTLENFAQLFYEIVDRHLPSLPGDVRNFFPYMQRGNWLVNYGRTEGIGRALTGMSRRTPYESRMDEAVTDLIRFRDLFEKEFHSFFPDLQEHVRLYLQRVPQEPRQSNE